MALIVLIAAVLIIFGFARVLLGRGDEPEDGSDPADENEPERAEEPGDMPEEAPCVDDPPQAGEESELEWQPHDGMPAALLGAAPPSLSELTGREPEKPPEGPVEGWIMPEPDASEMEHPEDYGIDNGDPDAPMWTPPEPEPAPEPEREAPRPRDVAGFFGQWFLYRAIADALYLAQAFFLLSSGKGLLGARFTLNIPGAAEVLFTAAALLLLVDVAVLALWRRRSGWVRQAYLLYLLVDLFLRAVNVVNGLAVGGKAMDNTFIGVFLAIASDGLCAWYLLRPARVREPED